MTHQGSRRTALENYQAKQRSAQQDGTQFRDMKAQNQLLRDLLFDDDGKLKYCYYCVIKIFQISRPRLDKLIELARKVDLNPFSAN